MSEIDYTRVNRIRELIDNRKSDEAAKIVWQWIKDNTINIATFKNIIHVLDHKEQERQKQLDSW